MSMPETVSSHHDMAIPSGFAGLSSRPLAAKRINMLPDVAVWTGGASVPQNVPLRVPVADVPS